MNDQDKKAENSAKVIVLGIVIIGLISFTLVKKLSK